MNTKDKKDASATRRSDAGKPLAPLDKAKILAGACALLCAITVGTIVWASASVAGAHDEVAEVKAETVRAVVANASIPAGGTIGADAVRVIDVPRTYLAEGAADDPAAVVGKVATANIPANAQIAQSNIAGEGNVSALAEALEPGMVAASIAVNSETGVAGLVRQGDYVDVLAEGGALIEGVRVLALDAQLTGDITQYSTVTLEMSVLDAGAVQAAQMDNPVRLVLNSRAAASAETGE